MKAGEPSRRRVDEVVDRVDPDQRRPRLRKRAGVVEDTADERERRNHYVGDEGVLIVTTSGRTHLRVTNAVADFGTHLRNDPAASPGLCATASRERGTRADTRSAPAGDEEQVPRPHAD